MKKHSILFSATLLITCMMLTVSVAFGLPSVSNVRVTQQTNKQAKVDIYYDLTDTEDYACTVYIAFDSNNDGQFDYQPTNSLNGAFANGVVTGANKHIEWNIKRDFPLYPTGKVSIVNVEVRASAWDLSGLSIEELAVAKYSSPYLLDFDFTLRDMNENAVIANPHAFNLVCKEDNNQISASETANFMERSKKQFKCFLVLDYTRSMDTDDGISKMESAAKLFLDSLESENNTNALNPDSQVGLYEFHAEDEIPQKVSDLSNSKKYLFKKVDVIWNDYVHRYPAGSRCWEAVVMAVDEFPEGVYVDEYRYVIFLSDGVDESSTFYKPEDIIAHANARGVQCLCIGFGAELEEGKANLIKIAKETGGHYYPAENTDQIVEQFKKIIDDIQARYTLRWETIKNPGMTAFLPSFEISAQGQSGFIGQVFPQYDPAKYEGNRRLGKLSFSIMRDLEDPSSVIAVLRCQYSPRHIHQFQLNIKTKFDFDWKLERMEAGGFCPNDWKKVTSNANESVWLVVRSPYPDNDYSSEFVFGGFGRILVINFRDVTSINQLVSDLRATIVNNDIYAEIGGMRFELDNISYSPIYKLDVASRYPTDNLNISISPEDKNLIDEDKTPFFLLYDSNVRVTLNTPAATNFLYTINYPDVITVTSTNTFDHWDVNGANNGANPILQLTITDDTTVTAVYNALFYQLNVQSDNLNSGVPVETSIIDINGYTNGVTPFPRLFYAMTNVTLSCPLYLNDKRFKHWLLDGKIATTSTNFNCTIDQNHIVQAVYYSLFNLTVNSENPDTGVVIQVSAQDISNRLDGITQFTRIYISNTVVTLTAPLNVKSNKFDHWQVNNVNYGQNTELKINIFDTTEIIAVYVGLDAVPDIALYESSQYIPSNSSFFVGETIDGVIIDTTFTITNTGRATLALTGTPPIILTNSLHNYFSVNRQSLSYISPSCTASFNVRFAPNGNQNGTGTCDVIILNSTTNINNYIIHLNSIYYQKSEPPTYLSATDGKYTDKIMVYWNVGNNADKYRVFRNTSDSTNVLTQISTDFTNTNFTDNTISPGRLYYYWVKSGKRDFWSELSESDSGYAKLTSPIGISATDGTYNDKVDVTWSNVFGAANYSVYRSETDIVSNATIIATVAGNNYTDTTVVPGTIYYYWIGATAEIGDSDLSGSDSGYAFISQGKPETKGKWKYKSKNGKAKLSAKGLGMDTPLGNYLEDGCLVGLKDASTYETVDGPRELKPKKKKNGDIKLWFYNEKKVAVIKYKPNYKKPDKDKLIYKVWKDLPAEIVFFVQPPAEDGGSTNSPANYVEPIPVYELYLSPGAEIKNGWRELITE